MTDRNNAGAPGDSGIRAVGKPIPIAKGMQLPVVAGLRPKQVLAARMLVEGRMSREVAMHLNVAPETVSRWRAQPEFHTLMRDMLQESIEATQFGLASLFSESIVHLRGLMAGFDDDRALRAISLLYTKAGPVLIAMNSEVNRALPPNPASR